MPRFYVRAPRAALEWKRTTRVVRGDETGMSTERDEKAVGVDLDEARRLVEALERDLARLGEGAGGVEALRSEVSQLRAALRTAAPTHPEVHSGLENVRDALHRAGDELFDDAVKVGDYVARIGRMLGL